LTLAELKREEPGGFRRDTSLAANQLIAALDRNSKVARQGNLALAEGDEELLEQNLPRVCRNAIVGLHGYPLW